MKRHVFLIFSLMVLLLAVALVPASAHEGREVGDYTLVFGWRVEPAYAGMMNGPEIILSVGHGDDHDDHSGEDDHGDDHDDDHSSDDHDEVIDLGSLEVDLRAEVSFGNQTTTISFRRAWGTTDHFIAELIPTLPGDYTFRVYGTIGDVEVNETFSSADGQFSTVEPAADIMFPALPVVDNARVEALEARIAELERLIVELLED